MYFPDLTPYQHGRTEPQANVLNVGWLSAAESFRRGDPERPSFETPCFRTAPQDEVRGLSSIPSDVIGFMESIRQFR
jgi:hypothetical protein